MFKNYFRIALRNITRNKIYTFINLTGLVLGIACTILICGLLNYHLSFDTFHKDKDRIFRVVSKTTFDTDDYSQGIQYSFGEAFKNDYTLAEKVAVRVKRGWQLVSFQSGGEQKKFKENMAYADPSFFEIFNYPLEEGNSSTAIASPNTAIITRKIADKFFPGTNAIGKQITTSSHQPYVITGVLKDIPDNSDNQAQIYLSIANFKKEYPWMASDSSWGTIASSIQCFVKLQPGKTKADAERVFPAIIKKYVPSNADKYFLYMQPLDDIHFNTAYDGNIDKKYLWALGFTGLFLIITACINFINLATAQSLGRAKEVGLRKTLGSSRLQIFRQFMTETAVLVIIAIFLSCWLALMALPWVNQLFDTHISLQAIRLPYIIAFLLLLFSLVTLLAGYYPALVLSAFKPVQALKGRMALSSGTGFTLRKSLVVVQFVIVQAMIIGAIIVSKQMNYSLQSDLGFDKEGIVVLDIPRPRADLVRTLRNRFTQIAGVEDVSFCYATPMGSSNDMDNFRYDNRPSKENFQINTKRGDNRYLSTFGLQLVAGQNLANSDTANGALVNETFVKRLNAKTPADVIGKTLDVNGYKMPITGVVKDFHNYDFHYSIDPICIYSYTDNYYTCAIKINMNNKATILPGLEKIWKETFPEEIYSHSFVDQDIANMYENENLLLHITRIFAGIAIVIGCLGLFGLVSFMAVQKTKEIGVRKVLGASVASVIWLFGKEFGRLLLIAFIIAAPAAWWLMHHYLQDFQYRISIGAGIFVATIGVTFLIAAITVGYHSARAALMNPVKALKNE
ncbi:MAG: ABC transporter permease [Chitinophagaceae bacterium]